MGKWQSPMSKESGKAQIVIPGSPGVTGPEN